MLSLPRQAWPAPANLDYATDAWVIDFSSGQAKVQGRDQAAYLRLVRHSD